MPYWIVTTGKDGSPGLMGPYLSMLRAQKIVDESLEVEAEIVRLGTVNPAKATRELKEGRIEKYGYSEGVKRFRHTQVTED